MSDRVFTWLRNGLLVLGFGWAVVLTFASCSCAGAPVPVVCRCESVACTGSFISVPAGPFIQYPNVTVWPPGVNSAPLRGLQDGGSEPVDRWNVR